MWHCVWGGEREFAAKIKTPFKPKNNKYIHTKKKKKKNPKRITEKEVGWGVHNSMSIKY